MKHPKRDDYDRAMIERANRFYACVFLGSGRYETESALTIDGAREAGRGLARKHGKHAAMIYAVLPDTLNTSIHVENVRL